MTATDAQTYWMSAKIPSDQFLLFCFAGVRDSVGHIADVLRERAATIPDLTLRVRDVPGNLDHPYWVPAAVSDEQVRTHPAIVEWDDCLEALAESMTDQLDLRSYAWRVHLFGPLTDAPRAAGASSVIAVLQIGHALADGARASQVARTLFDDRPLDAAVRTDDAAPTVFSAFAAVRGVIAVPLRGITLPLRAVRASRAHRDLDRSIGAGTIAAPTAGGPRTAVNVAPGDRRALRVVLTDADRLRAIGGSVTVGAMMVVADALAGYLDLPVDHGLRAEVTIAKPGVPKARNHFRNAGVDLRVGESDPMLRAAQIRRDLADVRARTAHPLTEAESAAIAAVPAPLLRWGVMSFDTSVIPETVIGNTVVSSVNRGAADLSLGGGTVQFTAGFPALSPLQSLTHGVHGIGDTVAISITASPDVVGDLDGYRDRVVAVLERGPSAT